MQLFLPHSTHLSPNMKVAILKIVNTYGAVYKLQLKNTANLSCGYDVKQQAIGNYGLVDFCSHIIILNSLQVRLFLSVLY